MKTTMKRRLLADLFEVRPSNGVLKEALVIIASAAPRLDPSRIVHAYRTLEDLYSGAFPGYQSCNTGYHDLNHAVHTFLAMARLIQGATAAAEKMTDREVLLALIAAAFHDAGYIQALEDRKGTGAKYKTGHEQRSIDWLDRHAAVLGLTPNDVRSVACLIRCTDMSTNISEVPFTHGSKELLGRNCCFCTKRTKNQVRAVTATRSTRSARPVNFTNFSSAISPRHCRRPNAF
jgi:hypothetical protein